jgi:hypothetical protein
VTEVLRLASLAQDNGPRLRRRVIRRHLTVELTPLKELRNSISQFPDFSITRLLHFFMVRMFPAPLAKFAELQTIRRGLAVLGRRVIPLFANTALQCNDFSWHLLPQSNCSGISDQEIDA